MIPRWLIFGALTVAGAATLLSVRDRQTTARLQFAWEAQLALHRAEYIRRTTVNFVERVFPAGLAFDQALVRFGIDPQATLRVVQAARQVSNLGKVHAGNRMAIGHSLDGELRAVKYQIDLERTLEVKSTGLSGEFEAEITTVPPASELICAHGSVQGSLFEGVIAAGEKPDLAIRMADIFGWDLDFHTDTRRGDTFRIAVEKKTYQGGEIRYARVVAAEYVNAGKSFQAVLFRDPAGKPAYYAPDGSSLQKAFLRSPLKFSAPITSRFSHSRLHPVLKRHRPHLGIDYGAPHGAPVQAIGNGRVLFAGYRGANGNFVHVRHSNGYETMYLHLSKILVSAGEKVSQGELIGRVGATGLATGPHLDFRITQNGAYRNFAALNLPPAEPVARSLRAEFESEKEKALALLTRP